MKENLKELQELLIIIDMVNGFVKEGTLANPEYMKIVPKQIELIKKFIERKQGILFIKDTHTSDSVEFKTFPAHCLEGTEESELIDELKVYENYGISIPKNSTSFMFAKGLIGLMNEMENLKTVVGCGVLHDVCVPNGLIPLKNYFNEMNRDVEIIVSKDTIDTYDAPGHSKEEYAHASDLLMKESGIKLVRSLNDIEWREI